jgi:hypothetical protein
VSAHTSLAVVPRSRRSSKAPPVVSGGMGRCPFPGQSMSTVDGDVVLVAEGGDGEIDPRREVLRQLRLRGFDGPARVAIFLS